MTANDSYWHIVVHESGHAVLAKFLGLKSQTAVIIKDNKLLGGQCLVSQWDRSISIQAREYSHSRWHQVQGIVAIICAAFIAEDMVFGNTVLENGEWQPDIETLKPLSKDDLTRAMRIVYEILHSHREELQTEMKTLHERNKHEYKGLII